MKRILVIQTASIGDVILATSLIEYLHVENGDVKIDLLIKKGNESLFTNHPFLNELLIWDKRSDKYKNLYSLVKIIRSKHYDLVVNLQRFLSSGVFTVLSGAKETIGFTKNPLSFFFSRRVEHLIGTGLHEVERNLKLVTNTTLGRNLLKPRLYPCEADFNRVKELNKTKYYTISPASLWFTKQYPVDRWAELVKEIPPSSKVLLLGSKQDVELCDDIIHLSNAGNALNLAGKLSLLESAALMKGALMNFTNDSAPMHLASAMNAPVAAIFCSTTPEFGFGPLSDQSFIIQIEGPLLCRPCGIHGLKECPEKHFRCAYDIPISRLKELI